MPFCHVHLRACRPLPELLRTPPKTPGDHLRQRRFVLKHTQAQAAEMIGVSLVTVWKWEIRGAPPHPSVLPALERYVGYDLAPTSAELGERVRAWREEQGLRPKTAARQLGIAPNTLAKLEKGQEVTLRVRMQLKTTMDANS